MAGIEENQKVNEDEAASSFVWDHNSQLYYHASSGFYHDPKAGWYYSTSDGLYYKFENGNYVLLESVQTQDEGGICAQSNEDLDHTLLQNGEFKGYDNNMETRPDESNTGNMDTIDNELPENPPPPSEWLEDTLIELYLSGYSNHAIDAPCGTTTASDERMLGEINGVESFECSIEGARTDDAYTLEEGEWIPDENDLSDEGATQEEENWRAQYGQVIESDEQVMPFPVVDLWDWKMVRGTKRNGKGEVARLVGRLARRSIRLHPSMPSGSGLLKTAPICEARLDLVRVTSGQVYKLRTPSATYLASMQAYDSSDPTKDWDYPQLSIERPIKGPSKSGGNSESTMKQENPVHKDSLVPGKLSVAPKAYRDRAAERRVLHGGFGVGPGQKSSPFAVDGAPSSPVSDNHEVAAAESLNKSFGAGSYARKILESMGWQEGEALGRSAVGNKGNAGLGWDHSRR
ncbi:RNA-binding 5 [Heracleum sosnowskyi]|uniref:RNA-binding 5 n=1 Tax=Heracleum sosnowskyi TaxID=360622 RepID=A0AAD8GYT0_9APIA|nr:RNA-binding 5 [Heracleum sosnowskyi]